MDECIDNDTIKLNFQGIEMRGLNDSSKTLEGAYERRDVMTSKGLMMTVMVRRCRADKKLSILTMHDIGTNYTSFTSFFNYPEMRVLMENFTVYHVCAPGHSMDSSVDSESRRLLPLAGSSSDGDISNTAAMPDIFTITGNKEQRHSVSGSVATAYPSMEELAEMVGEVIDLLSIGRFIGFGMGAGSNILTRLALHRPAVFNGLILLNPNDTTSTYYTWAKFRWSDLPKMRSSGQMSDALQDFLLNHWFGYLGSEERTLDVEESYLQSAARELDPISVAGYLESYLCRTALGLVRPSTIKSATPTPGELLVDTILITGDYAKDLYRTLTEMNGNMNPTNTQFVAIPDCTGMVMEEAPQKLAILFLNFLRNLGIMVSMTSEKLQKLALESQVSSAASAVNAALITGRTHQHVAAGDDYGGRC